MPDLKGTVRYRFTNHCQQVDVKDLWVFQKMSVIWSDTERWEASWKFIEDYSSFLFNLLLVTPLIFTTVAFLWNKYLCTSMEDITNLMQKCWSNVCALHRESWVFHTLPSTTKSCSKWIFMVNLLTQSKKLTLEDQVLTSAKWRWWNSVAKNVGFCLPTGLHEKVECSRSP